MGNIVEVKGVRKVYRMGQEKIVALDNVDLEVEEGKYCCLLGTSGSGKSTLLNMMAGLEKPTKGSILIKNYPVEKMTENQLAVFRQKFIGFVFQSYNLLPSLTALENVTMPLMFKGVPAKVRKKRALKMLKAVGLEKRVNHKPSEMSGGQQQRVSIARSFINNPQILFADEPTGNLDTSTTEEVMKLIIDLAEEHNQTLIIVTHDVEIADFAHKIVHMRDGNIEKIQENNNRREINYEGIL
ncbi:ABC transporter ATP-binding protein [Dethiothermospora halolimnae]|uniref:ABC transporter ATP-binding protein n=1 Tax=Dethiothermospora halolimnae TaxID=3114390 RepID=UPI003CCBF212